MIVNLTYPPVERGSFIRRRLLKILRWPFIFIGVASIIVNLCIGSPWWWPIALLSLYSVWKMVISPDLVEYNRTSQLIKLIVYSCVMLTLIDVLLAPGWAAFVVPLVCFGGVVFAGLLFFTDMETQKHNMLPLVLFLVFAIIGSSVGLSIWHEHDYWPFIVLGVTSLLLLLSLIIILGKDFLRELERRFHVK